jgi:DNA-binding protein HU-alpha
MPFPNRVRRVTGKFYLIALDSRLAGKPKPKMRHIMATTTTTKSKAAPRKSTTSKNTTEAETAKTEETLKMVGASDLVAAEPDLKKKELIDQVVERSQIKKKDAKPVVEAMLAVLGETIASGRESNLQPLGKLRINRTTDKGNGRIIICKLRQSTLRAAQAKDTLAVVADKL